MWKKEKKDSIMEAGKTSFFGEGLKLHGDVVSDHNVRVEGVVYGNVTSTRKVVVGRTGQIFGNVTAINLWVMGDVAGEIMVSELAVIDSTGSIRGKLLSKNFQIEPGAIIEATLNGLKENSFKIEIENDTSEFIKYGESLKAVEL